MLSLLTRCFVVYDNLRIIPFFTDHFFIYTWWMNQEKKKENKFLFNNSFIGQLLFKRYSRREMNKMITKTILIGLFVISLTACGNDVPNETANESPIDVPNEETAENGQIDETTGQITDFDLDIELASNDKIDVDYEVERDETEASYSVAGAQTLTGSEALAEIEQMFTDLNLTKEMNEDEIIDQVLAYFEINREDVTDFDLDIEFDNQDKIDIDRDQL